MTPLTDAWNATAAALPPGWRLEGLRCTSTGLLPDQRADNWLAEACGPYGECIRLEHPRPEAALEELANRLRSTPNV